MNAILSLTGADERVFLPLNLRNVLRVGFILGLTLVLTACNSTTLLLVNFGADAAGSEPSLNQNTGTVLLERGSGSITVVDAPAAGLAANKWARIIHPSTPTPQTGIKCNFAGGGGGAGGYGVLMSLYIPNGTGAVTIQFEQGGDVNNYNSFMHLDFMPQGDVRVNDNETLRFGQFPRDQVFVVSVNLVITATSATAEISLLGTGASGNLSAPLSSVALANQFGAVRVWMGYQWTGTFFVDDIIVNRRNS